MDPPGPFPPPADASPTHPPRIPPHPSPAHLLSLPVPPTSQHPPPPLPLLPPPPPPPSPPTPPIAAPSPHPPHPIDPPARSSARAHAYPKYLPSSPPEAISAILDSPPLPPADIRAAD